MAKVVVEEVKKAFPRPQDLTALELVTQALEETVGVFLARLTLMYE